MRMWFAKRPRGFIATDEQSARFHASMADGECAVFEVVRPRSVQWHRMYFGICREIGFNQDPQRTEDSIDGELRVRAGHFDMFFVDGHEVRMPKRIAFNKLDGEEWSALWPSLELAIRETFGEEYIQERARDCA